MSSGVSPQVRPGVCRQVEDVREVDARPCEALRGEVAQLFVVMESLCGWHDVSVGGAADARGHRPYVKELVDVHYPDTKRVVLISGPIEHPQHSRIVGSVPTR